MNNTTSNMSASEPVAPGLTEFCLGGIRNGSGEIAHDLIVDAAKWVEAIINDKNMSPTVIENPVLVAVHVKAALLDFELGRIVPILERGCTALEEIAESLDFIAARSDGDEAREVPTERESWLMYHALEGSHLKRIARSGQPKNVEEMDAALLRLKKLAGR